MKGDDTTVLTEEEANALLTALDSGYFSIPRQEPLSDLADTLGISDTEASRRLRRAMTKVFREHRDRFESQLDEDDRPPSNL